MRRLSAAIAAALLMVGAPAEAEWHKAVTNHFVIYSDQSPQQLQAYAAKLERFDQAVRFARRQQDMLPSPANKLTVYAVEDLATVQRLYGGGGVGGFYINRAGASVTFVPLRTNPGSRLDISPDAVFFHEYAHHLMYQDLRAALPLWLIEGFAEFYSTAKVEQDGSVALGAPATHRAEILLAKLSAPMPIDRMLDGNLKALRSYYLAEIYGRGWLLVHYLTFNPERRGQLEKYVAGIQTGKRGLDAARDAFGDLNRLNGELRDYVRSTRFPYVSVPAANLNPGPVQVRSLTPGEKAFVEVHMRSRRGVDDEEAAELVPIARRAAAGFASDPFVQAGLAEAEFDAGNFDEALAAADRALAADPRSIDALTYKGMALAAKAEKAAPAQADWKSIRAWFLKANKLDPENPIPLVKFYESFAQEGIGPTANAAEGLLYALALAPHDNDVRKLVVRELVAQKRATDAAKALRPLAYAPHGGKSVERAQAILEKLESNDLTGATKAIEEAEKAEKEEEEKAKKKR